MSGYPNVRKDLPWAPDAMKGYVGRQGVSTGVHDPLLATAAAFEVDDDPILLIGIDTLVVTREFTSAVRSALASDGIDVRNVLVAASHTHAGPDLFAWWDGEPVAVERTIERTVAAARQALERLQPAELSWGQAQLNHVSVNRRDEHGGALDTSVSVLRAVSPGDGSTLGLVAGFACHPVTLDYANLLFSADCVGPLRNALAAVYPGATTVFLNGAAGNVNPARFPYEQRANIYIPQTLENYPVYWGGFPDADRVGRSIAGAAVEAAERALPLDRAAPRGRIETLELPLKQGEELERFLDFMNFGEAYRESLAGKQTLTTEVQLVVLGGVRIVALPGEPFVELGLDLKTRARGEGPVLVVGFANDDVRYVMTADAYVEGQYETVGTPLEASSANMLVECAAGIL
jgi:neutral ceramidase